MLNTIVKSMSSNLRIEINSDGVRELLHDDSLVQTMEDLARNIVEENGEGYDYDISVTNGKNRSYVTVKGVGYKTVNHNKKINKEWG